MIQNVYADLVGPGVGSASRYKSAAEAIPMDNIIISATFVIISIVIAILILRSIVVKK